ncbi:MAG: site-specific DNA-methyltransferase [Prevotellaceae bacterium]|nr:site-specific DNA-methyltransferase [Prevotellaceae bacterium]
MNNNFDSLINLLKADERYVAEDGNLLKAKVYQDAMMMEENLLNLLLSQEETKEAFFTKVGNTLVFDKYEFAWLINSKEFLPDSYTAYTNKIGLATNRKFISQADDVVLDFPYKDAVLAGGQDKDDQKRDEIMFHSILAREQITNMLTPKVFTNAKRYTTVGDKDLEGKLIQETIEVKEELAKEFKEDDNLIIKGNNLIALSSLLERYEGKVKLIYIDPPYNTGSDSFGYNDRFNHSTWLTFMKNRLEIAWKLLNDDGTIWISIDDYESHYLKVLADGIFGRDNFLNDIVWQRAFAPVNLKKTFSKSHDYILVYCKNNSSKKELNSLPRKESMLNTYTNPDNDPRGDWTSDNFSVGPADESNIYEIVTPSGRIVLPPEGRSWLYSKMRYEELLADHRVWFGVDGNAVPRYKRFLSEVKDGVVAETLWTYEEVGHNQEAKKEIKNIFDGKAVFRTPKPERLLQRILTIGSSENDLVLDFFMGSATAQAVAMKMKRRFIGIEQMDYIHTVSVPRLHKVMEGEQGGISKEVHWQGGGSFVYCELKEDGQTLIEAIQASDENTIGKIKNYIYQDERIVPYLTAQELETVDNEFEHLDIKDKKRVLIELVDKNKLYVSYSSIDDEDYDVSDEDKSFSHSFYEGVR